ncbi:MAG: hypothetical protein ABIO44_08405 [Saprospiraceae bacterium]
MRLYQINLILCLALVFIGLWSYEASGRDAHTLSVPVMGILLSLFHRPLKAGNEKMIKGAMASTLLVFIIMLFPLRNSILADHTMAIFRVSLVLVLCAIALIYYYRYFRVAHGNENQMS